MIKFSIIVPVYNIEQYIDQCIESLVNQTYTNLEILLVNDGATDGSPKKLNDWKTKDSRIIVVNKQNGGLSSARNVGLKYATGDYISYIDGDDWVNPQMYEKLANKLTTSPMLDILCFGINSYYSESHQEFLSFNIDSEVYTGKDFLDKSRYYVGAWSKIYRRDYLNQYKLEFLHGRLHEDISYTVPLIMMAKKVSYIDEPLYVYRRDREGSILSTIKDRNVIDFANALAFAYRYVKQNGALTPYFCRYICKGFYTGCLSTKTHYNTLKKAFELSDATAIIEEITKDSRRKIYYKLRVTHYKLKSKTIIKNLAKKVIGRQ